MAQSQTAKAEKKPGRKVRIAATEKAAVTKVITPKAAAPKAEKVTKGVNPHVAVLGDGTIEGSDSGLFTTHAAVEIALIDERNPSKLPDRKRKALYKLRKGYEGRQFSGAYLDAGIMKVLLAAGLVSASGGQKVTRDGKTYLVDGETPVTMKLTSAGLKYGTA
jgi:hypothetical protein